MFNVLATFPSAKPSGSGHMAKCPAHEDRTASLSINTGDDGRVLLKCHAGCSTDDILDAHAAPHTGPEHRGVSAGQTRENADLIYTKNAMLNALTAAGSPLTSDEWCEAVEARKQLKLKARRALVDEKTVTRTGNGKANDPYLYQMSSSQVPAYSGEPPEPHPETTDRTNKTWALSGSHAPVISEKTRELHRTPKNGGQPTSDDGATATVLPALEVLDL